MYYAQSKIVVQNYSLTQGQSVSLYATEIQITGPFYCSSSSAQMRLVANVHDSCVCNTAKLSPRMALFHQNTWNNLHIFVSRATK
jgi:hypothetical protein